MQFVESLVYPYFTNILMILTRYYCGIFDPQINQFVIWQTINNTGSTAIEVDTLFEFIGVFGLSFMCIIRFI